VRTIKKRYKPREVIVCAGWWYRLWFNS